MKRSTTRAVRAMLLASLFVGVALLGASGSMAHGKSGGLAIEVLSNRGDLLSGGNALVEVKLSKHVNPSRVRVSLNGDDVTSAFAVRGDGRFVGLVDGLAHGANKLTARASTAATRGSRSRTTRSAARSSPGRRCSRGSARPQRTDSAPATDAQCNAPTTVVLYKTARTLTGRSPPTTRRTRRSDVAHDDDRPGQDRPVHRPRRARHEEPRHLRASPCSPTRQPWSPWAPQAAWNHKLVLPLRRRARAPHHTQSTPTACSTTMRSSRGFMVANSS